jgi:phosphopantothenoylcysteine decarboxylase
MAGIVQPIPQQAEPLERKGPKRDMSERLLPSLTVKQDPTLKSCLSSTTSLPRSGPSEHPSFVVRNDTKSPNRHGLIENEELLPSHTASIITGASDAVSPPHTEGTKATSGSASESQPLSQNRSSSSRQRDNPLAGNTPQLSQPPPLSRISSLRYVNNSLEDKRVIENTNRQRTASPTMLSPQLQQQQQLLQQLLQLLLPILCADAETTDDKKHLMIAITGCTSVKSVFLIIDKLFELYTHEKLEIQVIMTKAAQWFLTDKLHKFEESGVKVWFHDDGIKFYLASKALYKHSLQQPKTTANMLSKYMLAFELQKWIDVLLIAPLSANTMAKLINGLSDNLLTDMLHVWPVAMHGLQPDIANNAKGQPLARGGPPSGHSPVSTVLKNDANAPKAIIAALALTNSMYSHPITKRQIAELNETYPNMCILKPVEKCVDVDGNIAMGGMRSWGEVVNYVVQSLGEPEEEQIDDEEDDDEGDDESQEVANGELPLPQETEDPEERPKRAGSVLGDGRRRRHDTVTNRELNEHQKIATINAMLNTGMGGTPTPIEPSEKQAA